jgi:hypothetical protein
LLTNENRTINIGNRTVDVYTFGSIDDEEEEEGGMEVFIISLVR